MRGGRQFKGGVKSKKARNRIKLPREVEKLAFTVVIVFFAIILAWSRCDGSVPVRLEIRDLIVKRWQVCNTKGAGRPSRFCQHGPPAEMDNFYF